MLTRLVGNVPAILCSFVQGFEMKVVSSLLRLMPLLFLTFCLTGCGGSPATSVVEQPEKTAEEIAAEAEAYNKAMDN